MLKRLSEYLFGKGDPLPPPPAVPQRPQLTAWPVPLKPHPEPAPELLTKNWSHPFGDRSDVFQQLTHLGKAANGFYPIGVHGTWHGGVHFDDSTASVLDQSRVLCMADGEVVAYRIPTTTPTTRYAPLPKPEFEAPCASGFVLVRHRIQAPPIENTEQAPPALTFYSLYMHLEDWAAYDGSPLDRPRFWVQSEEQWVKDDANDIHRGKEGLKVIGHEGSSRTLDILPPGTQVAVSGTGRHRKLENTPGPASLRSTDGTLRGYVSARHLRPGKGDLSEVAGDVLNVRAEPHGQATVLGGLAKGTSVRVSGSGDFVKLEYIEQYVLAEKLRSDYVPAGRDDVFVPEKPIPIKAGELIGHIGPYQNARDDKPRRHLHLEVFCVDYFPDFLEESRAWAKRLPAKEKTWLKLKAGTEVVFHRGHFGNKAHPTNVHPHLISDHDLLVPKSLLDNLPADKKIHRPKTDTAQGCTWYRLESLFHDAEGNLVDGWVKVMQETASWVSPWEWDGYEIIETPRSPVPGMAYRMYRDRNTSEEDRNRLCQQAEAWDKGELMSKLYSLIDRNHDRQMCADEVRAALKSPVLAQALSKIVLCSESEWYYRQEKWDALDQVFGHTTSAPLLNWIAEKGRIKELGWWEDVVEPLKLLGVSSVYFLHPLGLASHFMTTCSCGCCSSLQFRATRYGTQYGPVLWGNMKLADYKGLTKMIASKEITESDGKILTAMSENEGNMDALQSYDSEVLTAGAMQKTVKNDGRGELSIQIDEFKSSHPSLYEDLFAACGWTVEKKATGAYLSYEGKTGLELKKVLREGFDKDAFDQKQDIKSRPLAAFAHAIQNEAFLKKQVMDFVERLQISCNLSPNGFPTYKIRDFIKSDLGKALVLDQHVNRPSFVPRDFGTALKLFFANNPSASQNPSNWGDDHQAYEIKILEWYGANREMTHAHERYKKLKRNL